MVFTIESRPNDDRRPFGVKRDGETVFAGSWPECVNRLDHIAGKRGLTWHFTDRDDVCAVAD